MTADLVVWLLDAGNYAVAPLDGIATDGRLVVGRSPVDLYSGEVIIAVLPDGETPTSADVLRAWRQFAVWLLDSNPDAHGDDWAHLLDRLLSELPGTFDLDALRAATRRAHDGIVWSAPEDDDEAADARARFVSGAIRAEVPDVTPRELAHVVPDVTGAPMPLAEAVALVRRRSDAAAEVLLRTLRIDG